MSTITFHSLPEEDHVYRVVHRDNLKLEGLITMPTPKAFSRSPADTDGLSVDWAEMTTPAHSIATFGATYKHKKNPTDPDSFKNPESFTIYKLNVGFIKKIQDITDVVHTPVSHGNPPPKGKPNNPAHSTILYSMDKDPEIKVKLRSHAIANGEVEVDLEEMKKLLATLRNPSKEDDASKS